MFAELHPALKLDQKQLSGQVVTIVEDEDQLGTFLLHHFLSSTLRSDSSILFLGLSQTFGFYHTVLKKSGVNVVKAKEAGQLVFVDLLKDISETYCNGGVTKTFLGSVMRRITEEREALSRIRPGKPLAVIIDKLSALMALGLARNDVESFYDSFLPKSTASAEDCTLVVLASRAHHANDQKELAMHLMLTSDLSIVVTPLRSGRSTTITGNLCFEWAQTGESGRFQYRLEDKMVKVFALGTCDAVL
jgi:KaiC/GvpD/RAD55 family RecA-like ATPase